MSHIDASVPCNHCIQTVTLVISSGNLCVCRIFVTVIDGINRWVRGLDGNSFNSDEWKKVLFKNGIDSDGTLIN